MVRGGHRTCGYVHRHGTQSVSVDMLGAYVNRLRMGEHHVEKASQPDTGSGFWSALGSQQRPPTVSFAIDIYGLHFSPRGWCVLMAWRCSHEQAGDMERYEVLCLFLGGGVNVSFQRKVKRFFVKKVKF